jgi:Zn-dependent metalloprotease
MKMRFLYGALIGFCLLLFAAAGFGATLVYLPKDGAIQSKLNQIQAVSAPSLQSFIGLTDQEDLKLLKQRIDKNNITRSRYQQMFMGIPVWGYHIIVAENAAGAVVGLYGTKVAGIAADIPVSALSASSLNAQTALSQMKERHITNSELADQIWVFENEVSKKVIYIDDNSQARLCFRVSFFVDVA